ncbi:peptidase propeptide and YPEB domain protein [Firmicutes bacterium CAG:555]|nr:peptidase propeptide and YPEB domain protein [Firmicutes bacterium CAG:555]
MRKENIEQRLRHEFSDIAPNRLDEVLAAVDALPENGGTVIDFTQTAKKRRSPLKAVLSAAATLLLIVGAAGLYANLSADRYIVAVDVNPAVELRVNGFDRISAVTLKNDDAKTLISEDDLKGKTVSDAVDTLTEKLCGDGYLNENSNGVLVSVHGGDDALCSKIVSSIEKATERAGFNYAVLYQSLDDDADGKAELIAKLDGRFDDLSIEELSKLSVQELIFLAESLDSLPDKTELYGKLNGYLSAEDAKHDAGVDSASATQSIIRYAEQLAYEIVYTENGTTHKYVVSASTGEVLAHEKHGNSSSGSPGKNNSKNDGLLSADDILKIFKKTFGFVDAVLDDVHVTRSMRNGEPVYIVTYKVFGVTRSAVFDARTAEILSDIG